MLASSNEWLNYIANCIEAIAWGSFHLGAELLFFQLTVAASGFVLFTTMAVNLASHANVEKVEGNLIAQGNVFPVSFISCRKYGIVC
jgi:hypothetical protein